MLGTQRHGKRLVGALVETPTQGGKPVEVNKLIHVERLQRRGASEAEIVRALAESDPPPSEAWVLGSDADVMVETDDRIDQIVDMVFARLARRPTRKGDRL
jgi:hypothetical protein